MQRQGKETCLQCADIFLLSQTFYQCNMPVFKKLDISKDQIQGSRTLSYHGKPLLASVSILVVVKNVRDLECVHHFEL